MKYSTSQEEEMENSGRIWKDFTEKYQMRSQVGSQRSNCGRRKYVQVVVQVTIVMLSVNV